MSMNTALLVIDVQAVMFHDDYPVFAGEKLLEHIQELLVKARANQVPIIYVQHNEGAGEPLESGTPGWEIHSSIAPEEQDTIVQKTRPNSFYETNLQQILEEKGIKRLVLTGIQTDMCVDGTCLGACELGYEVTVVKDAHSTWGQETISAAQIIEQYNEQFATIAAVQETAAIIF
ncbi:cysteine hydrolase family protein [Paenibacillus lupini]|nr:cysteine hydrolase family protein [Paenibacillus lupini]NIK21662.1 nicotinamidase-related amidase [Paenibacillus lupini]